MPKENYNIYLAQNKPEINQCTKLIKNLAKS